MTPYSAAFYLAFFWAFLHLLKRIYPHIFPKSHQLGRHPILPTNRGGRGESTITGWLYELGTNTKVVLTSVHLRLETTWFNTLHDEFMKRLSKSQGVKLLRGFYDLGFVAGVIGLVGVLFILALTAGKMVSGFWFSYHTIAAQQPPSHFGKRSISTPQERTSPPSSNWELAPIIPGVTVPLFHLPIILVSLLFTQIVHELGHAISAAADSIHLLSSGLSLTLLIPGAFVSLSSSTLSLSAPRIRGGVASAGAWHNLFLYFLVYFIGWTGVGTTLLKAGGWEDVSASGVVVVSVQKDSPLHSHIPPGSIITQLDDTSLVRSDSAGTTWDEYLLHLTPPSLLAGYCVASMWLDWHNDEGCCSPASEQHPPMSFSSCFTSEATTDRCLDPLEVFLPQAGEIIRCDSNCGPGDGEICIRARDDTNLLRITYRKADTENDDEEILVWRGPGREVLQAVQAGSFRPRYRWLSLYFPTGMALLTSYISTITLSLFFFNLLPLPYLDGAEVLSALLDRLPTRPSEDYDLESTDGISQPRNDRRWKQRVEKLTASVTAFLAGSVLLASVWKEIGRG